MNERSFFAGTFLSVAALVACGQSPVGTSDGDEDGQTEAPPTVGATPKSADDDHGGFGDDASASSTSSTPSPRTSGDATTSAPHDSGAPMVTSPDGASASEPRGTGGDRSGENTERAGTQQTDTQRTGTTQTPVGVGVGAGAGAGNASSRGCDVPGEAQLEDVSNPTTVVGNGTPGSCTSGAVVAAVARGGVITFNCGPNAHTIVLDQTAKVMNASRKVVIDGGGKVALSGGGRMRILYQNTCDGAQGITTSHCDNQDSPQLTVQNLTFVDGDSRGTGDGGGAIFAQGGRLKIINSSFHNNVCPEVGPDVGGGAVRALMQYNNQVVYVVNSTFGGAEGRGNVGSNGGALSSIGVSYTVLGSVFTHNRAIGHGANPAQAGTPGGGSGGAIYNDGTSFNLHLCGSTFEHNTANAGGGGIFFVSNDRSGSLTIENSTLADNPSGQFFTHPGMYVEARGQPNIWNSQVR